MEENQLPAISAVSAIPTAVAPVSATATTTSTTVPAATATGPPSSTTAASALRLRTRFVDYQISPAKILSVQRSYGAICVFIVIYFHKGKPARLSGKAVADQIYISGGYTDLREPLVELLFCCGKRKIADIKLLHLPTPPVRDPIASPRSALKKNWHRSITVTYVVP
jgi:hypothetical protein